MTFNKCPSLGFIFVEGKRRNTDPHCRNNEGDKEPCYYDHASYETLCKAEQKQHLVKVAAKDYVQKFRDRLSIVAKEKDRVETCAAFVTQNGTIVAVGKFV